MQLFGLSSAQSLVPLGVKSIVPGRVLPAVRAASFFAGRRNGLHLPIVIETPDFGGWLWSEGRIEATPAGSAAGCESGGIRESNRTLRGSSSTSVYVDMLDLAIAQEG